MPTAGEWWHHRRWCCRQQGERRRCRLLCCDKLGTCQHWRLPASIQGSASHSPAPIRRSSCPRLRRSRLRPLGRSSRSCAILFWSCRHSNVWSRTFMNEGGKVGRQFYCVGVGALLALACATHRLQMMDPVPFVVAGFAHASHSKLPASALNSPISQATQP